MSRPEKATAIAYARFSFRIVPMNEEHFVDPSPAAKPERETAEGRLDLRAHHHLSRSRYRLLNLRDCVASSSGADEVSETPEQA